MLRRFRERLRAQDWFGVSIELVIVVVGVFLGMQVTNWNAERVERRAGRSYVERIRADLGRNEQALEARIAYYLQVKKHALAALAAFDRPKAELGEPFLVDAFQASQILSPILDKSTYVELISAGAMNSIPDVAVRRQIASFYQNLSASEEILAYIPPYRENLRRQMPYPVQEAMNAHCDDLVTQEGGLPRPVLPEECSLDLPPALVGAAVAELLTPELKLDLQRRLADIDTKITNFRRLLKMSSELERSLGKGTG